MSAGVSADQLRSLVQRVERLREEVQALQQDVAEIYKEARGAGFDVKALKVVIGRRAMDAGARETRDALVETYERALGTGVATRAGAREVESADA